MDDNVRFIRLITGEDIISVVTSINMQDNNYYILNNPMKVVYTMPAQKGYYAVALSQWVSSKICDQQEFTIYPTEVLTVSKPTEAMVDYYWSCVDHFAEMLEAQKQSMQEESVTESQDQSSSYDDPVDDSDTMELVKEVMEALKVNKNTLH